MNIDFTQIDQNTVERFRGGEGVTLMRMYTDENNKIMEAILPPGSSIGLHTHETNSEIIHILSGTGKVLYDGEYETLSAGSCHYCPKGHSHSLINDSQEDLCFFAVIPEHSRQ